MVDRVYIVSEQANKQMRGIDVWGSWNEEWTVLML